MPGGNWIQRRFVAPSDHNGYCGENARFFGWILPTEPSAYNPVSCKCFGKGEGCAPSLAAAPLIHAPSKSEATIVPWVRLDRGREPA